MQFLKNILGTVVVIAIVFGWRYVFPSYLACDATDVKKGVMELVEEGYGKIREAALAEYPNDPTANQLLPATIDGELTDIVSTERAKTRGSTSVCHAVYKFHGDNLFESISIDYRVTGEGFFSNRYQVQTSNAQPNISAAARALLSQ